MKSFGDNSSTLFFGARETREGHFEMYGVSSEAKGYRANALITTVDNSGKQISQRVFRQPIEELLRVVPSSDGGYLLLGAGLRGPRVVKVSSDGALTK
jgi:hypothetical protein